MTTIEESESAANTESHESLRAKIDRYEEALLFYADADTYRAIGFLPDLPCGSFMDDFSETPGLGRKPGLRARIALGWEDDPAGGGSQ